MFDKFSFSCLQFITISLLCVTASPARCDDTEVVNVVLLANYGTFPAGPDTVRAAFVTVADSDPKVEVVRTMKERPPTYYPKVDGGPYNAEGQKRLGTAMAKWLKKLK